MKKTMSIFAIVTATLTLQSCTELGIRLASVLIFSVAVYAIALLWALLRRLVKWDWSDMKKGYKEKSKVDAAEERAKIAFADDAALWEETKKVIDEGSQEDIDDAITKMKDSSMNYNQKERTVEYLIYTLKYREVMEEGSFWTKKREEAINNLIREIRKK